jgi:tetratricopeptide (TPR) repeat protein
MKALALFAATILIVNGYAFAQFKLYEKGHQSYKAQQYDDAIQSFTDFLNKPAHDRSLEGEVHYLRGLAYYKKENYQHAIEDLEDAVLLNHKNKGNIYWFIAKCNDKLGLYNDAIETYSSAILELNDKIVRAKLLLERSSVHLKLGSHQLAINDLDEGSRMHPGNDLIQRKLDSLQRLNHLTANADHRIDADRKGNETQHKSTIEKNNAESQSERKLATPIVYDATLAERYKEEKRYALVIGNSAYPQAIGALRNSVNDAIDIAAELQQSGFEVQLLTNATYGQIRVAMLKFKEKVDAGNKDKTVALFYYAGHGLQHDGENYIVPVDATIEYEDDVPRYCFPIQRIVLANMERANSRMNIIILDACRNNPFPSLTRSLGNQGLAEMSRGKGSFIAYATAPGSVASDGSGRNGLYTQELLKAMRKSGLTIEQVFKEVRVNVLKQSGERQNTWDSSNITGEFHFKF